MANPIIERLAPPGVTALVCFLSFSSQWLFHYIEPGPLRKGDAYIFNLLVACLLICYFRTCFTEPGRIPKDWAEQVHDGQTAAQSQRWCRKCEMYKPPRAHHCKTCQRCIMKMDHHCVWTANCISHITLPHFIRFLSFAVAAMIYLEVFLYARGAVLWSKRHLPSYLGPSHFQLAHIFVLVGANSLVLFAMILLLGRSLWCLALNMTTIEGWEVERHEAILRRARTLGGHLDGPDGPPVRIEHQEFPWDIGIWTNICHGMGSYNPFSWLWPLASSPSVVTGLRFQHNEIDDPSKPWPPPDPDRMFRAVKPPVNDDPFLDESMDVNAFRRRQAADLARFEDADGEFVVRRRPFHERLERLTRKRQESAYGYEDDVAIETDDTDASDDDDPTSYNARRDSGGEEAWRNREGERLQDFGVDEVADFYDQDDLPLAKLKEKLIKRNG